MMLSACLRRVLPLGVFLCAGAHAQSPAPSNLQNQLPQRPVTPQQRPSAQVQRPLASTPPEFEKVPVRLSEVRIAGVKAIGFAEVSAMFQPLLNTDTTIGAIVQAANKVTALYAARGYPISYAYVPVQKLSGGVVQVVVVEGYISSVSVKNAPPKMEEKIRGIASQVLGERPLTQASFERYVSLVSRLPGVGVDANVPVPVTVDGGTELQLGIRFKPWVGTYAIDFNHPGIEGLATGTVNGVTGLPDQVSVSYMLPRGRLDRDYASLDYSVPVGLDGLNLRLNAYQYRGRTRDFFLGASRFSQDYLEKRAGFLFSYPFVLTASTSVVAEAGAYASVSGDLFTQPGVAGQVDARASVRALQGSVTGTWQKATSATDLSLQLSRGLNGHGAGQQLNLVDLGFLRAKATARRKDDWMGGAFNTFVTAVVQQTPDRLPVTEKISFGGNYFGAAYPTGEVTGDTGQAVAAEIARPFFIKEGYVQKIEPYINVDYAQVGVSKSNFRPASLGSASIGVRVSRQNAFMVALSAAKPVGAQPFGQTGRPVRFNLQASITY